MKKVIIHTSLIALFTLGFIPAVASASTVYFQTDTPSVSVGDTFIITAKLDPQSVPVNTVEGDFVLSSPTNAYTVNDFSLAGSVLTLWPKTPSLSTDGSTISFVGGVPGGFSSDKSTLFNIVVEASKAGDIKITPQNIAVYANDGKATRVPVTAQTLDITVNPKDPSVASTNQWQTLVGQDKTKPQDFTIAVGSDPSFSDGKRFAFFNAVDNESGISYYEVSEDGGPAIRSGSVYVLTNQDPNRPIDLKVTAFDKAGNSTLSVYKNPVFTIFGLSIPFIVTIIVIVALWFIVRRVKKSKKKHNVE